METATYTGFLTDLTPAQGRPGTAPPMAARSSSNAIGRTQAGTEGVGGHRVHGLGEGDLLWAYDMAAMGQKLQPRLWGRPVRQ